MDIPPYISVSILNNPSFTCTTTKEDDQQKSDTSITILPKKRSFDVAFLISSDDKRRKSPSPQNDTIRSAFRKVGYPKPTDSRSPSPIDPIRTPSPQYKDTRPTFQPFAFAQREKNLNFGFLNPVPRNTFLPAPIFATPPIIPTNFVTAASLLPPSLAALSLPAQNVCAKCNVSFRMTSDLVYHMRSHHKNDHTSPDQLRRRRELDKLKCPVCNESFRERHHLTRHMTAHQDKDGDNLESGDNRCRIKFCASEYRQWFVLRSYLVMNVSYLTIVELRCVNNLLSSLYAEKKYTD